MSTYLISKERPITRQAGDVADIIITVPDLFPLSGRTNRFQVRDNDGRLLIDKADEDITVNGQVMIIVLLPADTARLVGIKKWELESSDANGPVTIGHGPFTITKTYIP